MARKFGNLSAQDAIEQTPYKSGTAIEGGFRSALAQLKAGELAAAITKAQQREAQLNGNYIENPFGGTKEPAAPMPNSYVQMLEAERQRQQAFAAGVAPRVQRVEDIRSLGDAANYVGGVVGATPVTMAPVIGAAVAGRVGGKLLAPAAGRVSPALASALPTAGSGAAAYATSYDMLADENLNAQLNDPIAAAQPAAVRRRNARLAAAGGAAFDAVLPVGLVGAARKLGMSGGNAAAGVLAGAGVEGATEAAQLGLQNMQLRNLGGTTMQDSGLDYLNAGVAGAIGGGAMSGAAAGLGYTAGKLARPKQGLEESLAQEIDAVEAQPQKIMSDADWRTEWEKAQPGYAGSDSVVDMTGLTPEQQQQYMQDVMESDSIADVDGELEIAQQLRRDAEAAGDANQMSMAQQRIDRLKRQKMTDADWRSEWEAAQPGFAGDTHLAQSTKSEVEVPEFSEKSFPLGSRKGEERSNLSHANVYAGRNDDDGTTHVEITRAKDGSVARIRMIDADNGAVAEMSPRDYPKDATDALILKAGFEGSVFVDGYEQLDTSKGRPDWKGIAKAHDEMLDAQEAVQQEPQEDPVLSSLREELTFADAEGRFDDVVEIQEQIDTHQARRAAKGSGNFEQDWRDYYAETRHGLSDELFIGGQRDRNTRVGLPEELRSRSAHGMAKSLASAAKDLRTLLDEGVDPNRGGGRLYTAPFSGGKGSEAAASASGTASGSAYTDGAFTLIAREGVGDITDVDQIEGIAVNGAVPNSVVESLRAEYPHLKIGYSEQLGSLFAGDSKAPSTKDEGRAARDEDFNNLFDAIDAIGSDRAAAKAEQDLAQEQSTIEEITPDLPAREAVDVLEGNSQVDEEALAANPVAYEQTMRQERESAANTLVSELSSGKYSMTPVQRKQAKDLAARDQLDDGATAEAIALYNQVANPSKLSDAVQRLKEGGAVADSQVKGEEKHSFADAKLPRNTAPLRREIEVELVSSGLVNDPKQAREVAKNIMLLDTLSAQSDKEINAVQYAAMIEGREVIKKFDQNGNIAKTLATARELEAQRLAEGKQSVASGIASAVRDTESASDPDLFNRFTALTDMDSKLSEGRWEESVMMQIMPAEARSRMLGINDSAPDNVKRDGVARPILHIATQIDIANDPAISEAQREEARGKLLSFYKDKPRVDLVLNAYKDLRSAATKTDPRQLDEERSILAEEMAGNTTVAPLNNEDYTLPDDREGETDGAWMDNEKLDAQKDLRTVEYMGTGKHNAPFPASAATRETAEDREWVGLADHLERSASDLDPKEALGEAIKSVRAEVNQVIGDRIKSVWNTGAIRKIRNELGLTGGHAEGDNLAQVSNALRTKYSAVRADLNEVQRLREAAEAAKADDEVSPAMKDLAMQEYRTARAEAIKTHGEQMVRDTLAGQVRFSGDRYSAELGKALDDFTNYPSWVFDDETAATIAEADPDTVRKSLNELKVNAAKNEDGGLNFTRQEVLKLAEARDVDGNADVQEQRGHRLFKVKDDNGKVYTFDTSRVANAMLKKLQQNGSYTTKAMSWTQKTVDALIQGLGSIKLAPGFGKAFSGKDAGVARRIAQLSLARLNPNFFPEVHDLKVGDVAKTFGMSPALYKQTRTQLEEDILMGKFPVLDAKAFDKELNKRMVAASRMGAEEGAGIIRVPGEESVAGKVDRQAVRARAEKMGVVEEDVVIEPDALEQPVKSQEEQLLDEERKEQREIASGKKPNRDLTGAPITYTDKALPYYRAVVDPTTRFEYRPTVEEATKTLEAKSEKKTTARKPAVDARQKAFIDQTNEGGLTGQVVDDSVALVENLVDVFTQLAQNGHLDGNRTSAAKKAAHVWVEVLDPKSVFHIGRRALAAGVITTTQYEAILEKTGHAVDKREGHTFVGKSTPGFADDFKKAMKLMSKDKTMSEQELFEQTGWFRDARGEWRKDVNTVGEYTSLGANLMQMEMNGETIRNLGAMLNGQGAGRALRTHMDKVTVSMPSTWSLDTPNTFDEAAGVIHVNPVRQILHAVRRDQMFKLGDKVISYRELKLLFGKENAKGELVLASKDEVSKRFAEKFPDVGGALETALNDAAAASALEGVQRIVQQLSYAEQQVNNWTGAAIDYLGGDKEAQKLAAKIADPKATLEERGTARLALLEQVAQTVGATIYDEDGSVNTEKRDFIADIIAQQMAKDPREREIRNMLDSRFGTTYPRGSKLAAMEAALTDEQRAVRDQMTAELTRMIGTQISQQFDILEGDSEHGRGSFVEYRALDGSSVLKVLRFAAATQSGDTHVARHESVHAFFSMLKGRAKQQVWRDLRRAIVESSRVRSEVVNYYKDQKAVLDQLDPRKNPDYEEELMAYAFQLYVDGKLNLNPKSRNFFNKVVAFVANILGLATQEQRAAALFDALFAGELNPTDPEKGGYGGRNIANKMRELSKRGKPTETFRNKLERTAPGVARMADTLFATPTEVLRNSGSKALTELAEMFAPHMASARNGGLIANRGQRAAQFHNRWSKLVGRFEKAEISQALADAQAMREPTTTAGREVRKFLSDMYQYSNEAGVKRWDPKLRQYKDIVEMQNYFPRVWEHGYISQHEDEFKALIKKYSKMSEDDIDALLREIAENDGRIEILTEKAGLDAGFTPFQSSISQRGFTFIDESNAHEFAKFQSQDMNDIMAGYIEQAVHRAEYTRLFGNRGEVIDKLIQRAAVEDGISPEEIIQTYRYHIDALSGTLGAHSMGRGLRLAQATAITAQNIILLPFAIFSQAIDGLGSSVRTGNIRDAKNAYGQVLKDMTRFALRDKSYDYAQDVAEMLGVVSQEAAVHAVNNAGMFMMNKGLRNVNRHFFRWNGMSGWNDSMRKAAMITGIQFLEQHTGLKGGKVDERRFEELGLTLEEAKDMVVRFREGEKRGVAPEFSTTQAQAMYRFVDQAVIRPNASMRASWLSDPRWMIFAHLKQFTYGMHKVTIARAMHEADNDNAASLAILAGYAPMALAADMTKWALLGMNVTEDWGTWDYMRHAVARGGLLGLWEFGTNVAGDAGSGRIPGSSLVGPTVEHGMTVAQSLNVGVDKPVDWDRIADRSLPGHKYLSSD